MDKQEIDARKQVALFTTLITNWSVTSIVADLFMGVTSFVLFAISCIQHGDTLLKATSAFGTALAVFILLWNRKILADTANNMTSKTITRLSSILDFTLRLQFFVQLLLWATMN